MQSKNIDYLARLDHLRFLAVVLVLFFHTEFYVGTRAFFIPLIQQGHAGVALFMVISGMILTLIAYDKDIVTSRFYLNRILRIYPLFAVVVLVGWGSPSALLPLRSRPDFGAVGGQMWSVIVELQFYLLFPFIYRFRIWLPLLLLIAIRCLLYSQAGTVHQLAYFTLLGNLDAFLVGMLVARLYKSGFTCHAAVPAMIFVVINAVLYFAFRDDFFHIELATRRDISNSPAWIIWPTVQAFLWGAFVLTYLTAARIPNSKMLESLGQWSFSIYAWHIAVLLLALKLKLDLHPYILAFGILLVTIAVSFFSYRIIERPFLSMRVRYLKDPSSG
jgi:peptidoglycan/LPS O-acetylase OafA/YrhL